MKKTLALLITATLACCACTHEADSNQQPGSVSPSHLSLLDENELTHLKLSALAGDTNATNSVIEHYFSKDLGYTPEQEYWLTIGAENGDLGRMVDLGRTLAKKSDPYSCQRARFWYEKVTKIPMEGDLGRIRQAADLDLKADIEACEKAVAAYDKAAH